jgi:oligopeptide transport system substrate-binding protein
VGSRPPGGINMRKAKSFLLRFSFFITALFAAANSACTRQGATAAGPQVLRVSQRNEPAGLDPAQASLPDEFFIIRALSEGLVTPAPGGNQRPAAAERWEISADGLTYTFHLRVDARWSNGEPVTAADFVESYRRVLTPATAAPKAALLYGVKNARAYLTGQVTDFNAVGLHATDEHTLVVTLGQPMPDFLAYVASGPWIPVNPRVVAARGREWTRPGNFVGNGPFILAEWQPAQRIVVRKNPLYSAAADVRLDEIDFLAFDNEDAEERAFRAGQVDVTMTVPVAKLATYTRDRPAELRHAPLAETRYLTFNTARPPLNDVRVRRALGLAIDREKLVKRVLLGGQEAAGRFLPAQLRPRNDADLAPAATLRYDPAEARRLLAEAGFPGGQGFRTVELTGWSRSQTPVLEAIQAMWKTELGIGTHIAVREATVHKAALVSGEYDIGYINAIPDLVDALDVLKDFATGAPGNYPHWSDARYDELLAGSARAADTTERNGLLHEAETRLGETDPVAPLYYNTRNWLMSPRVRGWQEDALWTRFYAGIFLQD